MSNEFVDTDQAKKVAANATMGKVGLKEFLSCFYRDDDTVYLRLLNDKKTPGLTPREFSPRLCDVEKIVPELQSLNMQNYGVFYSVNGARTDREVTKISSQFFECDDIPIEDQLENIKSFPLKPSIVISTRKSLHVYFLIKYGKVADFRKIQLKLAKQFQGDKTVVNESRVLRVPLFYHNKFEPIMVECLSFNPDIKYTQEELEKYLPQLDDIKPLENVVSSISTKYKKGSKEQLEFLCETCDFIKNCKENSQILSESSWYSMITNLYNFEDGKQKIHEFSKNYILYSEDETNRKIEHFIDSKTAPVNCSTLNERGFKCPNYGKCKCKSPAGLPFTEGIMIKLPEWYFKPQKGAMAFMPGILSDFLAENVKSLYVGEIFFLYKAGVYKEATDYEAQKIIKDHLLPSNAKTSQINDVFFQWRLNVIKKIDKVNTEQYILNLKNGLLDIRTNELKPFDSNFLSTIRINANYEPLAECPKFIKFLEDTLEPDLIPVLQQMMGYCLTTFSESQKCFLMLGLARTGKSTIINLMEHLIGSENCSNIPLQELGDRFKTAELFSKILNTFADLPNKAIEDAGMFKALVSNDMVMAERKSKNPFNFRSMAKLVFSTNDLPQNISDRTDGFFRRLIIIRFLKQVPEDKVNAHLFDELLKEVDGIFNWSLKGLKQLIDNKFIFINVKETQDELKKYRLSASSALTFIEEECEFIPTSSCSSERLYTQYKDYCINSGYRQMSNGRFNNETSQYYSDKIIKTKEIGTRRNIWKGIRKLNDNSFCEGLTHR